MHLFAWVQNTIDQIYGHTVHVIHMSIIKYDNYVFTVFHSSGKSFLKTTRPLETNVTPINIWQTHFYKITKSGAVEVDDDQQEHTQGAKSQCFGKPDMACCKRLCDKNIIHGPSGVN